MGIFFKFFYMFLASLNKKRVSTISFNEKRNMTVSQKKEKEKGALQRENIPQSK